MAGIARGGGRGGGGAAVLRVAAREAIPLGRSGVVGVAVLPSHWGVHFHRSDEMLLKQKKDGFEIRAVVDFRVCKFLFCEFPDSFVTAC